MDMIIYPMGYIPMAFSSVSVVLDSVLLRRA